MKTKTLTTVLTYIVIALTYIVLAITLYLLIQNKRKPIVIKDPMLIYADYRIEELDYTRKQGLIGVIDRKELKKVLGIDVDVDKYKTKGGVK